MTSAKSGGLCERLSQSWMSILSIVLHLDWLRSPCDCFSRPSLELQIRIGKLSIVEETYVSAESCLPVSCVRTACVHVSGSAVCYLNRAVSRSFSHDLFCSDSYLVDPASSHMLVSKIKPCMSQYKLLYGETANGSLKQL